ncbi:isoprenoid biosynthesis protein ElbB, partial [Vibrio artabrorum]
MKNVAVLLSGNGVYDGAEINEAVLTLLALEEAELEYQCFAPNRNQHHVINHVTGEEMPESRNMMIEASRIVRGNIQPITVLSQT